MRRLVVVALVLVGTFAGRASAAPRPVTESAALGDVRAQLTYVYDPDVQDYTKTFTQLRLVVERAGTVLVDRAPRSICSYCTTWPGSGGNPHASSVRVADLDRNGEPVVMLDLYTGGAHCCLYTVFLRYEAGAYATSRHDWGNPGYTFRDLGGDGVPEFVTSDDRFNYAFSCYACSATPIRVLHVAGGKLVDETRQFPALVRRDAAAIWRGYRAALRRHEDPAGLLPAYLADESVLGRSAAAWPRVRAAVAQRAWPRLVTDPHWRNRGRYLAAVRRFLRRTGYLR